MLICGSCMVQVSVSRDMEKKLTVRERESQHIF